MLRSLTLLVLLAAPPAAAEQLSLTLAPRSAEEAQLLSTGLALYSLHSHVRDGGSIQQWGRDNAAALVQEGGGNWGLIRQQGRDHDATLEQKGGNNAHAIIQGGEGARADILQRGGEMGLTIQFGW